MRNLTPISLMLLACAGLLPAQVGDVWESRPSLNSGVNAPSGRQRQCGVWTGQHFIVWGGALSLVVWYNTGGAYDPATDQWLFKPNLASGVGAPAARENAVAVWTGDKMIVWGGMHAYVLNSWRGERSGGVYDLATDTWLHRPVLGSGVTGPIARQDAEAHWTGAHMLVFGGHLSSTQLKQNTTPLPATGTPYLWDGGLYDPAADAWISSSGLDVAPPAPRAQNASIWTGDRMLVFSGAPTNENISVTGQSATTTGRAYDPVARSWTTPSSFATGVGAPPFRLQHASTWTDTHFFVFGGSWITYPPFTVGRRANGGLYDPSVDTWELRPNLNLALGAPTARESCDAFWTGSRALVYGGFNPEIQWEPLESGGLYDPINDIWDLEPTLNTPAANPPFHTQPGWRFDAVHLYGSDRLFIWGGWTGQGASSQWLNTGAMYRPHGPAPVILGTMPSILIQSYQQSAFHTFDIHGSPQPTATLEVVAFSPSAGNFHGALAPFDPAKPLPQPAPAWFSFNHTQGRHLTVTPPVGGSGLYTLRLRASNGKTPEATAPFTVEIRRPATVVPHNTTVLAEPGAPFSYRIPAEGYPTPIYIVNGLPSWLQESRGHLTGTPGPADTGTFATIDWFAANNQGAPVSGQLMIVVKPVRPVALEVADVNEDGSINVLDVQLTVMMVLGTTAPSYIPHPTLPPPAQLQRGDIDGNGVLNVVDIQALVNTILGR